MQSENAQDLYKNKKATGKDIKSQWYITSGFVYRATPGSYDYLVRTPGQPVVVCRALEDMLDKHFGTRSISVISEGTPVVVFMDSPNSRYGVIAGVLPAVIHGQPTDKDPTALGFSLNPESGASFWSETAYSDPQLDRKNVSRLTANNSRVPDTLPGDWGKVNDFGALIGLFGTMATLKATDAASVEAHVLDDLVRIVSGQFQHYSAMGEHHIYNDFGGVTMEFTGSPHQPEVSGEDDYGPGGIFTVNGADTRDEEYLQSEITDNVLSRQIKSRVQVFFGQLADMFQVYIAKPQPGTETYERQSVNQGLFTTHVDSSGRLDVQAASGISLQRSDNIPVPKKTKEAWDPSGDKPEDNPDAEVDPKEPFTYDPDNQFGRNLEHVDALNWNYRNKYRLFDGKPLDWYTPEASEVPTPDNEYDAIQQATENFDQHAGKKAGVFVEADGSVIIRDAWGSEVYMRGGNIIMSCAGSIVKQPGRDEVSMAGHDHVVKAKNSIDISATDSDVRIKSKGNMHLYAKDKGILLETDSEGAAAHGYEGEGEDVNSRGITLKAEGSRVFAWAQTIHLSSIRDIIFETLDRTAGRLINLVGRYLSFSNATTITAGTDAQSSISLTERSARVVADSVSVAGDDGVTITRGTSVLVPLQWADGTTNPASSIQNSNQGLAGSFSGDAYLGQYSAADREAIKFTFRNTGQYRTDIATELDPTAKGFKIYQLPWQKLVEQGSDLIDATTEPWVEEPVNDTYPYPGKDNYTSNVYIKHSGDQSVDADGVPLPRSEINNESGGFTQESLDSYPVIRK